MPGLAALGGAAATDALSRGEPFVATVDDVPIRVEYTSGTTPTVFLSTPYAPRGAPGAAAGYRDSGIERLAAERPMSIELSRESDDERRAKATGVSREVQTGDPDFDRAIYVCSPSEDRVVSRVLASPRLRRAIETLLDDGFVRLEIDDEDGEISTHRGISAWAAASAEEVAGAFAVIAREVPVVDRAGELRRPTWPLYLLAGLFLGVPTAVIAALIMGPPLQVALGALAGGALGGGLGALFARRLRGRSDSHWRVRAAIFAFAGCGTLLATAAVLWHSGASAWPLATGALAAGGFFVAISRA